MGILLAANNAAADSAMGGSGGLITMVIMIVFWVAILYFLMLRPQKKEQQKLNNLIASAEIGDSVLTTSGFYGVIIDITDDTVIVEFGSNKNCRIPMAKTAISQIEKPGAN